MHTNLMIQRIELLVSDVSVVISVLSLFDTVSAALQNPCALPMSFAHFS